jgi:ABC-2 type transport system permease protein
MLIANVQKSKKPFVAVSLVNKPLVWFFLLFKPLYARLNVEVNQMNSLLLYKLMIDDRKPLSLIKMYKKSSTNNQTLINILLSFLVGLFILVSFVISTDLTSKLFIYFSLYIFVAVLTMINVFGDIFIDGKDGMILASKPISDRTFLLARMLHVAINACKILLPMNIPAIIFMSIQYNLKYSISFLGTVAVASLCTIFIVLLFYNLILKILSTKRIHQGILIFQLATPAIMYALLFIATKFVKHRTINIFTSEVYSNIVWLPSYWFAGAWSYISGVATTTTHLYMLILALLITPFLGWVIMQYLAPSFNKKLLLINLPSNIPAGRLKERKSVFSKKMLQWLTKSGAERMSFLFTLTMMKRTRDFKARFYPMLAIPIIVIAFSIIEEKQSLQQLLLNNVFIRKAIILFIYASAYIGVGATSNIAFSKKYKAAWLFFSSPIDKPGLLISGAVKSILIKCTLPILVCMVLLILCFSKFFLLPDIILAISNQSLIILAGVRLLNIKIPFSKVYSISYTRIDFIIGNIFCAGWIAIGYLHLSLANFSWLILLLAVVSVSISCLLMRSIQAISWKAIELTDSKN